ncbi:MAG: sigma-70 family RNA polymerase sigma factor [Planctomycetota bacterium]
MADPGQTCWELIEGAASGTETDRAEFVRRYGEVARSYLAQRWRTSPVLQELDDAVQEVFVECFRENGVLSRADPERSGGFRAYYFGVIRNVGRRCEQQHRRRTLGHTPDGYDVTKLPSREEGLARAFDRAWAKAIMKQAGEHLQALSKDGGPEAAQRVELLRLRFYQDRPIREIAELWEADPAVLHRQYARARKEFEAALFDIVGRHHAGTPGEIRREGERLLTLL